MDVIFPQKGWHKLAIIACPYHKPSLHCKQVTQHTHTNTHTKINEVITKFEMKNILNIKTTLVKVSTKCAGMCHSIGCLMCSLQNNVNF